MYANKTKNQTMVLFKVCSFKKLFYLRKPHIKEFYELRQTAYFA